jgi:hypothetical protein
MKQNLCTSTTRRIRKLGYTQRAAAFYAGFLCTSMVLVCAVMGALCAPSQVSNQRAMGSGQPQAATRTTVFLSADGALRR